MLWKKKEKLYSNYCSFQAEVFLLKYSLFLKKMSSSPTDSVSRFAKGMPPKKCISQSNIFPGAVAIQTISRIRCMNYSTILSFGMSIAVLYTFFFNYLWMALEHCNIQTCACSYSCKSCSPVNLCLPFFLKFCSLEIKHRHYSRY